MLELTRSPVPALLAAALSLLACRQTHADTPAPVDKPAAQREPHDLKIVETVYDNGLSPSWRDYGYAPRGRSGGKGPEEIDFSGWNGWILARPGLEGAFGGLTFRYLAPKEFGDFLEVYLQNDLGDEFPQITLREPHRVPRANGWIEVWVSMDELNPYGLSFDRLRWKAVRRVASRFVKVDKIGLTAPDPNRKPGPKLTGPAREGTMAVRCRAKAHPISPYIYGLASSSQLDAPRELSPTTVRWGGNPATRYNWQHGYAWNNGSDWFFRNVNKSGVPGFTFGSFLDDAASRGVPASITVPLIGWVARDITGFSFPVSEFGKQQETDPDRPEAGNGVSLKGKKLTPGPPTRTSVAAPPEFIGAWVKANREADRKRGVRTARWYILDNEPMLWNETHRDVHPAAVTYDELLQRTVAYGTAVRKADPEALIAGPAEWGWTNFLYSAADVEAGVRRRPDRRAHGDVPLLPWYLSKLREHEKKTGVKLLDVLDVHFYPMTKGMGVGAVGATDAETNARRIRSTRALWDPGYVDESWIDEEVRLIPRLKEWVAQNYPGLGISIGEYSWGAENHPSGGLALAEVLGRFGEQDLTSAYYWRYPLENSAAWWAFRAYRNYDGKGASFLDWSVPTEAGELTSLFASRDARSGKWVLIALNFEPNREARVRIALDGCGELRPGRTFSYQGGQAGFVERKSGTVVKGVLEDVLPAYAISVIELSR
ncbi:MAG: glycoside hydrolase family 44 protein [Myxococcaceae bacterium]